MKDLIKKKTSKIFLTLSRLLLGMVFIYASIDKIAFPSEFARIVENYDILPVFLIKPVAVILPLLELVLGLFLLVGLFVRQSALSLTILLIVFMIIIGIRSYKGPIEDCGCFSQSSFLTTSNIFMIFLRDFMFIGLGITTFVLSNQLRKDINEQN